MIKRNVRIRRRRSHHHHHPQLETPPQSTSPLLKLKKRVRLVKLLGWHLCFQWAAFLWKQGISDSKYSSRMVGSLISKASWSDFEWFLWLNGREQHCLGWPLLRKQKQLTLTKNLCKIQDLSNPVLAAVLARQVPDLTEQVLFQCGGELVEASLFWSLTSPCFVLVFGNDLTLEPDSRFGLPTACVMLPLVSGPGPGISKLLLFGSFRAPMQLNVEAMYVWLESVFPISLFR